MKDLKLKGIIPAMLTPLDQEGEKLDLDKVGTYVDFLLKAGVHGLFPLGTNGEGVLLSLEEKKELVRAVVDSVAGRVPVVVQTGAITTQETIGLTTLVQELGADGAALLPPYYYRYCEDELLEHYLEVARSVPDFPLYFYNIPSYALNPITPRLVQRIRSHTDSYQGLKDSSKNMDVFENFLRALEDFQILMGSDSLILPGLALGGVGAVSALADVFPEKVVALYELFGQGKLKEATKIQHELCTIRDISKAGYSSIACLKSMLRLRGLNLGGVRAPAESLSPVQEEELKRRLNECGWL